MKPAYRLSTASEDRNIKLAAKTRQVELWLAGLSGVDAEQKAGLLAGYLDAHDQDSVPASLRRQMTGLLQPAIDAALDELEHLLKAGGLPLDAIGRTRQEAALRLLLAQADFLKRLVLEHAEQPRHFFSSDPLPELVPALLHALSRVLKLAYQTHGEIPEGVWFDLHQTAELVYRGGHAMGDDASEWGRNFVVRYVGLMLESMADPYHISDQERIWTRDIIARLGDLVKIEEGRSGRYRAVYGVCFDQDAPPRPLSWLSRVGKRCDLALNTMQLVRRLATAINHMANGRANDPSLPSIRHPAYIDLLDRLKLQWGGAMRRLSTRREPTQSAPCRLSLGFASVMSQLSGAADEAPTDAMATCQLVNESLTGAALRLAAPIPAIGVGRLAYVGQGENCLGIGMVRWFRQGRDGTATVGMRFLAGSPGLVTLASADGTESCPAVLMQQEHAEATAAYMLLPSPHPDLHGQFEMRHGGRRFTVLLKERLHDAGDAELFRCSLADAGSASY